MEHASISLSFMHPTDPYFALGPCAVTPYNPRPAAGFQQCAEPKEGQAWPDFD